MESGLMLQFQHLELHHGCEIQESWILNVLFVANYAFFGRQLDPCEICKLTITRESVLGVFKLCLCMNHRGLRSVCFL